MILVHLCAFPKGGQVNCKISFFPTLLLPGEVVTHFLNQLQFQTEPLSNMFIDECIYIYIACTQMCMYRDICMHIYIYIHMYIYIYIANMQDYTCVHNIFLVMIIRQINIDPHSQILGSHFHLVATAKPNAEVPHQWESLWKLCCLPMIRALPVSPDNNIIWSISIENSLETRDA